MSAGSCSSDPDAPVLFLSSERHPLKIPGTGYFFFPVMTYTVARMHAQEKQDGVSRPEGDGMERIRFIEHKGKKILHLDFTRARADEVMDIIRKAKTVIAAQPERSIRTLTDVTDLMFNTAAAEAMKEFASHNKPYVAAAAVVGVTGLKQIIYNAVVRLSGRNLVAFDSSAQARDWLATQ